MLNPRVFVIVIACCALSACNKVSVKSDVLSEYAWIDAKTYAWSAHAGIAAAEFPEIDTVKLDRIIRREIDSNMAARDLRPVDLPAADLIVTYLVAIKSTVAVDDAPEYNDAHTREIGDLDSANTGELWSMGGLEVIEYTEGAMAILVKDAKSGKELWQSVAKSVVDLNASDSKRERRIAATTKKIFDDFPR